MSKGRSWQGRQMRRVRPVAVTSGSGSAPSMRSGPVWANSTCSLPFILAVDDTNGRSLPPQPVSVVLDALLCHESHQCLLGEMHRITNLSVGPLTAPVKSVQVLSCCRVPIRTGESSAYQMRVGATAHGEWFRSEREGRMRSLNPGTLALTLPQLQSMIKTSHWPGDACDAPGHGATCGHRCCEAILLLTRTPAPVRQRDFLFLRN